MSQCILLLLNLAQVEFLSLATQTTLLNIAPVGQSSVSSERQMWECHFMAQWNQGHDGRGHRMLCQHRGMLPYSGIPWRVAPLCPSGRVRTSFSALWSLGVCMSMTWWRWTSLAEWEFKTDSHGGRFYQSLPFTSQSILGWVCRKTNGSSWPVYVDHSINPSPVLSGLLLTLPV